MRRRNRFSLTPILRKHILSLKFCAFILCISLIMGGTLLIFRITTIQVLGPHIDLKGIGYFNNRFIFFVDPHKAQQHILKNNPLIKSVFVTKILPQTLKIRIEKSKVIAKIKAVDGMMYISEEGRVVSKILKENKVNVNQYPVILSSHQYFLNQFLIGNRVEQEEIQTALFFLREVESKLLFNVENIDIVNENMIVLHTGEIDFIFTVDKDKIIQFEELKVVIKRLGSKINEVKKIDVRFDKPLLTYE